MKFKASAAGGISWAEHDHDCCVSEALRVAEEVCVERGVRLTSLRRRVLELVWNGHKAIGAYTLLEHLQREGRAAPPTVYRALDFLLEQGLIHRLASVNAYAGCIHPGAPHSGQFLICEACQNLVEFHDLAIDQAISSHSRSGGFLPSRQTVEILGLCPRCQET